MRSQAFDSGGGPMDDEAMLLLTAKIGQRARDLSAGQERLGALKRGLPDCPEADRAVRIRQIVDLGNESAVIEDELVGLRRRLQERHLMGLALLVERAQDAYRLQAEEHTALRREQASIDNRLLRRYNARDGGGEDLEELLVARARNRARSIMAEAQLKVAGASLQRAQSDLDEAQRAIPGGTGHMPAREETVRV